MLRDEQSLSETDSLVSKSFRIKRKRKLTFKLSKIICALSSEK
jgi:hypothetical protein